jgi:hypothetical protein
MLGMMKTYDVSKGRDKVKMRTLMFGAKYERLTKPVASEYTDKNIRNNDFVILLAAGH